MSEDSGKSEARERQASRFDQIAREAEALSAHARTVAQHFRAEEIARAGAHAFAVDGHFALICRLLEESAIEHAQRSRPVP